MSHAGPDPLVTRIDIDPQWRDAWGNVWPRQRDAELASAQPEDPIRWRDKMVRGWWALQIILTVVAAFAGYGLGLSMPLPN
jgi:hypothetical protein